MTEQELFDRFDAIKKIDPRETVWEATAMLMLYCSRWTLRRWAKRLRVPQIGFNGVYRYPLQGIEKIRLFRENLVFIRQLKKKYNVKN